MMAKDLRLVSDKDDTAGPQVLERALASADVDDDASEFAELIRDLQDMADPDTDLELMGIEDFKALADGADAGGHPKREEKSAPPQSDQTDTGTTTPATPPATPTTPGAAA